MATFKFELVSPERLLMSEDVEHVVVPGMDGDFGVLPGHAPFVSTLRPGIIRVLRGGGAKESRIFVYSGFAEVDPTSLTILAQRAVDVDSVNPAEIAQQIKDAEEDLADAQDDAHRFRAQETLSRLRELQGQTAAH
jgi:F-type H+-transporting ATPase subunit epsilon